MFLRGDFVSTDDRTRERSELAIAQRDLERLINPLVAKESRGAAALSDAERDELKRLRLAKGELARKLQRLKARD
jgi:hypothetical protein